MRVDESEAVRISICTITRLHDLSKEHVRYGVKCKKDAAGYVILACYDKAWLASLFTNFAGIYLSLDSHFLGLTGRNFVEITKPTYAPKLNMLFTSNSKIRKSGICYHNQQRL